MPSGSLHLRRKSSGRQWQTLCLDAGRLHPLRDGNNIQLQLSRNDILSGLENGETVATGVQSSKKKEVPTQGSRTITLRDGRVISDTRNDSIRDAAQALKDLPVQND